MLNYNQKFKDRKPEETIKIIKQYFESLGCNIEIEFLQQQNSGTWATTLKLYHNNNFILQQNGKGTTPEFCLASGYGELYERFCNKIFYMNNHPLAEKIFQYSFENFGYYIHPKEKEISFEEAINSDFGKYFYNNIENNEETLRQFFDLVYNNKYIGVPFINAATQEEWYTDPRLMLYFTGSTGMAAGNTFNEAFVQAMSELYEHYVNGQLYVQKFNKYYYLNLNNIENKYLQDIIKKIQQNNILYIFDLSYNFNVPVLMSVAINKKSHVTTINLGSAPVFDIALERVLTELYQGKEVELDTVKLDGQYPSLGKFDLRRRNMIWRNTMAFQPIFPENIIQNMEQKELYNKTIFLNQSQNNNILFKHCLKINQLNNFNVYSYDVSGCKDMYALKVIIRNIPFYIQDFSYAKNNLDTKKIIKNVKDSYFLAKKYLQTGDFSLADFLLLFDNISELEEQELNYFDHVIFNNYLSWGKTPVPISEFLKLGNIILFYKDALLKNKQLIGHYHPDKKVYEELLKFSIPLRYLNNPNYSYEEIQNILNFLNFDINLQQYANTLKDGKQLIKNIIFAELNPYFEGKHDNYIRMLASYNKY